ncbi:hypothetical protein C2845_PM05G08500 [Panicum miliaceum]|uniref:C-22 sterol desaturase n=1 Tax=Panicum miliaceum TaxID=4540 RepID=A0A3L6T0E1_PANMI|nr:hypothetical protein C2845_PM05G08500 [Panicum miliaceum]
MGECAMERKARMRAGSEPECLMDYWMQDTVREMDEAEAAGGPPPAHTGDEEIGGYVFDFLFAAQDASTSSLCWSVSALGSHPDVLAGVRAEVAALWSPGSGEPITTAQMSGMRYTKAVAREVVRPHRPPATMVPHIAGEAFRLAEGYTVPRGATVFPSLYESSLQGFRDPAAFDPERFFSEDRREDVAFRRNFVAFGAGVHQCVGQRYALNHPVLFMALFVSLVDFRRHATEGERRGGRGRRDGRSTGGRRAATAAADSGECCQDLKGPGYATPLEAMEKGPNGEAQLRHLRLQCWKKPGHRTLFAYGFWYQPRHKTMISSTWGAPAAFRAMVSVEDIFIQPCDLVYIPTIAPRDGCAVYLQQCCAKLPSF